jgi:hypothetical protein
VRGFNSISEVNASNCFKAVVKLANGAIQYIWDESELVVP